MTLTQETSLRIRFALIITDLQDGVVGLYVKTVYGNTDTGAGIDVFPIRTTYYISNVFIHLTGDP